MSSAFTRREVLAAGLGLGAALALPRCVAFDPAVPPPFPAVLPTTTPWPEANALLAGIPAPHVRSETFSVLSFGAAADGRADSTGAFARAIEACRTAGGGVVLAPPGIYSVGAIRLRSGVELRVEAGATLRFRGDAALYPKVLTRYEGLECWNRSPMIYAYGEEDVALTGGGVLDASDTAAWNDGGDRGVLEPMVARGLPPEARDVSGQLRVSFVQPYACQRVRIAGVTLRGAQFWQLHPVLCTDVIVEDVTTSVAGGNSDGCNPESCERVVIRRCTLASGDDNIAIKSGRDDDGRRVGRPCKDIVIVNNQAEGRFGFITCGSELSAGIENVYAFSNWTYGRGVGSALWVKSNARRGGYVRNVRIDSFRGTHFRAGVIAVSTHYYDQTGPFLPDFRDLVLSGVHATDAPFALDLDGLAEAPIGPLTLRDSFFVGLHGAPTRIAHAPDVRLENVLVDGYPLG